MDVVVAALHERVREPVEGRDGEDAVHEGLEEATLVRDGLEDVEGERGRGHVEVLVRAHGAPCGGIMAGSVGLHRVSRAADARGARCVPSNPGCVPGSTACGDA